MKNVFFVGDELVAGHGDPKALGWVGRVVARTIPLADDVAFHTLAVPNEVTAELTARWDDEAMRRMRSHTGDDSAVNHVLFAIGRHDAYRDVSPTMTRLNIANALDRASALSLKIMVAGPPPGLPADNERLAELAAICQDAAGRRKVPYIDMYGPLVRHDQWATDMQQSRDSLPLQAGYGLMAWLVLHSQWHSWLGVPAPYDAG